jgi:hypothetical protein
VLDPRIVSACVNTGVESGFACARTPDIGSSSSAEKLRPIRNNVLISCDAR